jgi:probable F420-dependent oxidoreductase
MDLQVVLPNESAAMTPERPAHLAIAAEKLGFHTVWLPDHLLPPAEYGDVYAGVYEPLVTLTHIAALTKSIRLGTSVLVVPMRDPFVLAKQVATLDRLSGERVTLGVGAGWDEEEFGLVGADFRRRGKATDETLGLLRHLFTTGRGPSGRGVFEPRPRGTVPIMVGGVSDAALRRTATLADEWQGVGLTPTQFRAHAERLRGMTDRPVRVGTRIAWHGDKNALPAILEDVQAFADAGADALAVAFGPEAGFEDRMAEFATRTGPKPIPPMRPSSKCPV